MSQIYQSTPGLELLVLLDMCVVCYCIQRAPLSFRLHIQIMGH